MGSELLARADTNAAFPGGQQGGASVQIHRVCSSSVASTGVVGVLTGRRCRRCDSGLDPALLCVAGPRRPASGADRVTAVACLPVLLVSDLALFDPEGPQLGSLAK